MIAGDHDFSFITVRNFKFNSINFISIALFIPRYLKKLLHLKQKEYPVVVKMTECENSCAVSSFTTVQISIASGIPYLHSAFNRIFERKAVAADRVGRIN